MTPLQTTAAAGLKCYVKEDSDREAAEEKFCVDF
jgi:hypothetical protein